MSDIFVFDRIPNQPGRLGIDFVTAEGALIGEGGYGKVIKAKHRIDGKDYAIKKIQIFNLGDFNKKIKELVIWAQLDCDFFVQYRSSWVEQIDNEDHFLHIQMDLCNFSLEVAIGKMKNHFHVEESPFWPDLGYYMASEILLEIIECVNYLHCLSSPIIHRDIKPGNVLIKYDKRNARFVKLGDFGLSIVHERTNQSHTKMAGCSRFMAPEVRQDTKYNTKADVFSVGILAQDLFNFEVNKSNFKPNEKYEKIISLIRNMLTTSVRHRPSCEELLKSNETWYFGIGPIKEQLMAEITNDIIYDIENDLVKFFLKAKHDQMKVKC